MSRNDPPVSTWLTLPPTPSLPSNFGDGMVDVNGVDLWYADFIPLNDERNDEAPEVPVVVIHGGLAHSGYFGAIIEPLRQAGRRVIAVDLRGHGRSKMDHQPHSFELYASDVHTLLSSLNVTKASWLGWSNGAVTTMAALMNPSIAPTIDRAFLFAGFHKSSGINPACTSAPVFAEFLQRSPDEYAALQPTGGEYATLARAVEKLESAQPAWDADDLAKITLGRRVTVVGADNDETVFVDEARKIHEMIKDSRLVILQSVSHFAMLQDPEQFLEAFLASEGGRVI